MAINPFQLPQQGAIDARIDWTPLQNLIAQYNQNRLFAGAAGAQTDIYGNLIQPSAAGPIPTPSSLPPPSAAGGATPAGGGLPPLTAPIGPVQTAALPPVAPYALPGGGMGNPWSSAAAPAAPSAFQPEPILGIPGAPASEFGGGVVPSRLPTFAQPPTPAAPTASGPWTTSSIGPTPPPDWQAYRTGPAPPQTPFTPTPESAYADPSSPARPIAVADDVRSKTGAYTPEGLTRAQSVIASKEGGRLGYDNISRSTKRDGTPQAAIGKYGIMDFNVGPWTQEVLGRPMTPDEFLHDHDAQDKVFRAKFGQAADKYGSLTEAARWWLGGAGNMHGNVPDAYGTTPTAYAENFDRKMGKAGLPPEITQGRPAGIPAAVAGPPLSFAGTPQPPQGATVPSAPAGAPAAGVTTPPPAAGQPAAPGQQLFQPPQGISGGAGLPALTRDQFAALARNPLTSALAQKYLEQRLMPERVELGEDPFTGQKTYGFQVGTNIIPATIQGTPGAGAGPGAGLTAGLSNPQGLRGEAYLQTIDPSVAAHVRAVQAGREPMPSANARRGSIGQLVYTALGQADPDNMDGALYKSRQETLTSARSGKIGQKMASMGTAFAHLDDYDNQIENVAKHGDIGPNYYMNMTNEYSRKNNPDLDTRLKGLEAARETALEEVVNAIRAGGGSEKDIETWRNIMDTHSSPQAQHAVVQRAMHLLKGRMDETINEYNTGMQSTIPAGPEALLSPEAKEIYHRLLSGKGQQGAPADREYAQPGGKVREEQPGEWERTERRSQTQAQAQSTADLDAIFKKK